MIDVAAREAVLLAAHIPGIIMLVLALLMLLSARLLGAMFASILRRAFASRIAYAIVLVIAIGLVLDLDRPQRGLIRISLDPTLALQRSISK